jgi:peptide/nickel transport system substrate-binding protein
VGIQATAIAEFGGALMHKRLLALLGTGVLVFAACTSNSPGATGPAASEPPAATGTPQPTTNPIDLSNTAYKPEAGKTGGQIIFGDWQEANEFNPYYYSQVTEANVASAVWASLTVATHDYKTVPDLAKSLPTLDNGGVKVPGDNGDKMTVTWTLKDGLKWSDGEALTCDDFAFTWKWITDPGQAGVVTVGWEDITAVDCPNPTTIVMHFKNIFEGYMGLGTPLPQHYMKDISIADGLNHKGFKPADMPKVPTSGAFSFESVTAGQELRLKRNPNYKGFISGHPALLDGIVFKWYGDEQAMIAGFIAGEVDIATDLVETDIPTFETAGKKDSLSNINSLSYEYLALNWADGTKRDAKTGLGQCSQDAEVQDRGKTSAGVVCPVSDPEFRRALTYVIDKNDIATRILGGYVKVANTNISPDDYYYADQPPAKLDPAQAESILDAAGWKKGADGIRAKDGLRAKIELCSTTKPTRVDSLKLIADELKAIGIEAIAHNRSATDVFNSYNEATPTEPCNIYRGNFDIAEFTTSSAVDPVIYYSSYHSSQFEPKGANLAQISDPGIDKALDTVKGTVDLHEVVKAMGDFQRIYVEKTVEIPLFYRAQLDAVDYSKVGNFLGNPTQAGPTWNAVDWYLK